MATTGLVGFKQSNERKTVFMMILFPVFLFVICLLVMYFFVTNTAYDSAHRFAEGLALTGQVFVILLPLIIIRGLVTFFWQKDLMFHFAGAKELTRAENPDIYNTVENLCISRGLPMPKI
ncbi:hypothetical protein FACS1894176_01170 [Bacteroidia bacterium]|nr:hypothetical protein FACS1894176_01170 [Bacteroidia bacterium]